MSDLTKRPGETSTAFAIRCIKAEAWDEGMRTGTSRAMRAMSDEPTLPLASAAENPYLDTHAATADTDERGRA